MSETRQDPQIDWSTVPLLKPEPATVAAHYDRLSHEYDLLYEDAVSRRENRVIQGELAKLGLHWKHHVLDLGCGTGLAWDLIQANGVTPSYYEGLDLSPGMIQRAKLRLATAHGRNNGAVAFKVGDFYAQPPVEHYDAVVSLFGALSYAPLHRRGWKAENPFAAALRQARAGAPFLFVLYSGHGRELLGPWREPGKPTMQPLPVIYHTPESVARRCHGLVEPGSLRFRGLSATLRIGDRPTPLRCAQNRVLEAVDPGRCQYLIVRGRKRL